MLSLLTIVPSVQKTKKKSKLIFSSPYQCAKALIWYKCTIKKYELLPVEEDIAAESS